MVEPEPRPRSHDLEQKPGGKKCKGMEGIIEEAQELLKQDVEQDTLDAAGLFIRALRVAGVLDRHEVRMGSGRPAGSCGQKKSSVYGWASRG